MKIAEIVGVTLNAGILSVFYTIIGGVISYLLSTFVEVPIDDWKRSSLWYQIGTVSLELSIIGSIGFWITYTIRQAAPIFPVSKELDHIVDTYIGGVFFAYAMFLFINILDDKIKYLYSEIFDKHIEKMFPSRKTDKLKSNNMSYQDEL
jgi:uncharacterized membrane-anchored protein